MPQSGNTNTALFFSIEEAWKGGGYVFTFHPDKREEANATIRGLYARMRSIFDPQELMNVFTPNAVEEGQRMTWDPKTNSAISEEDKMIEELMDLDQDMTFQSQPTQYDSREVVVYQKDNFGTDEATAASFNTKWSTDSKASHPAKRTHTTPSGNDSISTASSLTATTKATLETRITKMESSHKNIEQMLVILIQKLRSDYKRSDESLMDQPMEISTNTPMNNISPLGKSTAESHTGDLAIE